MSSFERPFGRPVSRVRNWRTAEQAACQLLTPIGPYFLPVRMSALKAKADLKAAAMTSACRGRLETRGRAVGRSGSDRSSGGHKLLGN